MSNNLTFLKKINVYVGLNEAHLMLFLCVFIAKYFSDTGMSFFYLMSTPF